jgi:hypothetical protein
MEHYLTRKGIEEIKQRLLETPDNVYIGILLLKLNNAKSIKEEREIIKGYMRLSKGIVIVIKNMATYFAKALKPVIEKMKEQPEIWQKLKVID